MDDTYSKLMQAIRKTAEEKTSTVTLDNETACSIVWRLEALDRIVNTLKEFKIIKQEDSEA